MFNLKHSFQKRACIVSKMNSTKFSNNIIYIIRLNWSLTMEISSKCPRPWYKATYLISYVFCFFLFYWGNIRFLVIISCKLESNQAKKGGQALINPHILHFLKRKISRVYRKVKGLFEEKINSIFEDTSRATCQKKVI